MNSTLALTCILSMATSTAPAPTQSGQEAQKQVTPATNQIKVFPLEQADAREAAKTVAALGMTKLSVAVDARTNCLIATGTANDLQVLDQILARLDSSNPAARIRNELTVFQLRSNAGLIATKLKSLMNQRVPTVVDEKTNSLIVSADRDTLTQVGKLLEVLDKTAAKPTAKSVKLRVIWLMTGTQGTEPTEDLKPVVKSLARLGITNLKMVTQSLVNVSETRSSFDVAGSVGEEERSFRVSGERSNQNAGPIRLDMVIEAQPENQKRPASVEAAVTLSPGQTAVLGVTQTRTANSAFIVQLVEGL